MDHFQTFRFRPIHFVARPPRHRRDSPAHTLNVYVWRNLDDVLETLQNIVPGFRRELTADDVRKLAKRDWCDYYANDFSYDEFAAFWIVKTAWDPGLAYPDGDYDMFTIDGAMNYAKRLLNFDLQVAESRLENRRPVFPTLDDDAMKNILSPEASQSASAHRRFSFLFSSVKNSFETSSNQS